MLIMHASGTHFGLALGVVFIVFVVFIIAFALSYRKYKT